MQDPELKQRWEAGPHGVLRVLRRKPSFGRNLLLVFLFYVVVGFFTSYICIVAGLPRGASYGTVFRLAGTAAIACYILGGIPNAVFMGRSARSVLMDTIDGIVFGLLTAGVFGWLWPR